MERMTRLLAGLLRRSARLLPAGRRHWAEAVRAEAGQVPAGWRRLVWLLDGLWLVVREAGVPRKIVSGLGIAAIVVTVAAAVLAAWHGVPHSDPENSEDRLRVAVLAVMLAGLPWVARRRGVFGPVGDSLAARLVRTGGCAALCALIWVVVQIDRAPAHLTGFIVRSTWGEGGSVGSGTPIDWFREAVIAAVVMACVVAIRVVRARRPQMEAAGIWLSASAAGWIILFMLYDQSIITLYAAGIYAVTARRSKVAPVALGLGFCAAAAATMVVYAVAAADAHAGYALVFPVAMLVAPAAAGWEAARRAPGASFGAPAASFGAPAAVPGAPDAGDPARQRQARAWQGIAAGAVTSTLVALTMTILTGGTLLLVAGPIAGTVFSGLSAALGADHPRRPRAARSWSGGVVVLH